MTTIARLATIEKIRASNKAVDVYIVYKSNKVDRYPTLQVLNAGECFITASPITLGTITQRKELDSLAVDQYNLGRPARGWLN